MKDIYLFEVSPEGWKGTVRAMLAHHPEKFSKDACKKGGKKGGKMCPYAIAYKDKEEGDEAHYKNKKGKPEKKKEFKNESIFPTYREWVAKRT